jgi:hypothetical protein
MSEKTQDQAALVELAKLSEANDGVLTVATAVPPLAAAIILVGPEGEFLDHTDWPDYEKPTDDLCSAHCFESIEEATEYCAANMTDGWSVVSNPHTAREIIHYTNGESGG